MAFNGRFFVAAPLTVNVSRKSVKARLRVRCVLTHICAMDGAIEWPAVVVGRSAFTAHAPARGAAARTAGA
jgi:hypothetical protein